MVDSNYTHALLVVDRSGSMTSIMDDMNGGIKTLLEDQAKLPGRILVDVVAFDSTVETTFDSATPAAIIAGGNIIEPRGLTAMLDGIGIGVSNLGAKLAALPEDERPGTIIVTVVTDGDENFSQEWEANAIKALVEQQERDYNWTFVFLGANIDSATVSGNLGFQKGRTMDYTASSAGTTSMLRGVSNLYASTRSGDNATFSDEDREASKSGANNTVTVNVTPPAQPDFDAIINGTSSTSRARFFGRGRGSKN